MFDFTEFARTIYSERPQLHPKYLMPAMYGGEPTLMYDALFVLQDPNESFTATRWEPCETVEAAIKIHRRVFLAWASQLFPDILFGAFHAGAADFFERFYVTDFWKDGKFKERDKHPEDKQYWRSKLAIEMMKVPARCIITVGNVARTEVGQLKRKRLVWEGVPIHHVSFPSREQRGITPEGYKKEVAALIEKIQTDN